MKTKYIILVGLLFASDVSANALVSIGKALVIYSGKTAMVAKTVAPAVVKPATNLVPKVVPIVPKMVPTVAPNVVPKAVTIVPKVSPKMPPVAPKVVTKTVPKASTSAPNVVPKPVPTSAVDNSPDIPNVSPVIIWNKLENERK